MKDSVTTKALWAGIDIGGTKTAVVVSSSPPEVLSRVEFATSPAGGYEPAISRIKSSLHQILEELGASAEALVAIGVSCGGPLDLQNGLILAPPNLQTWIDVPIVAILSSEFLCPVRLENDANAGALAEHRFGAGRGARNIVFLTMGTGLGAGIIIDDRIYRGTNGMAGEVGHIRLTANGPMGYQKQGSAEGWASGAGLAQIAVNALASARQEGEASVLLNFTTSHRITARDVGLAAEEGDALALRIVSQCGEKLGLAMAILVDILNPERIIIGGLASRLGDLLLEPARKSLAREALQNALAVCRVVPASLGESIGDAAALGVALEAAAQSSLVLETPSA